METVSKKQLIEKIANEINGKVKKSDVKNIVEVFLSTLELEMKKGNKISLTKIGTLYPKKIKGREGVNPRGEKYSSKDKVLYRFKQYKNITESLN